jgi:predicted DNA-binding transcriptional regulator AlpA
VEMTKEKIRADVDIPAAARRYTMPQENLLRLREVIKIVPLSRPTIYRRIQQGKFPAPLKDGRCSMWEESKVRAYVDQILQQNAAHQACQPNSA